MNGNCQQVCVNTAGSFECHCAEGYELALDDMTCKGKYIIQKYGQISVGFSPIDSLKYFPTILMFVSPRKRGIGT